MRCDHLRLKRFIFAFLALLVLPAAIEAATIDFDDVSLPEGYYRGFDGVGGFVAHNQFFATPAIPDWSYWENAACSNLAITTPPDPPVKEGTAEDWEPYWASVFPQRELSAMSSSNQGNYGVLFPSFMTGYSRITFQQPVQLADISVTNTTYAYYVIRDGNKYSGGPFKAGDYFYATITGRDVSGNVTASIVYTLADYRNGNTFIAADWNTLDLSGLGQVKSLDISLTTTVFYQNSPGTPGYLAIDNLQIAGNPWGASWSDAQNTLWNVAANWGGTLPAPGESLLFDVPAGGISHNNRTDNPLVGAITFGSSAGVFTLEGQVARWQYDMTNLSENTQTVDMPLELTNAHQTIFTPLGDIVVSQPIGENSGSFGFVKTGSKTLFLSASNTYTGPTSIQEGSLCLLDGGDLATESVVTVAAGATLEVLGGDSVVGNINGAGTTIVYDGATLTAESIVQDTLVIGGTAYAAAAVPEPGTLLLLVLASAGLFVLTRKR